MKAGGRGLNFFTIPIFAWRTWIEPWKFIVRSGSFKGIQTYFENHCRSDAESPLRKQEARITYISLKTYIAPCNRIHFRGQEWCCHSRMYWLLWKPNVQYCFHKRLAEVLKLNQTDPFNHIPKCCWRSTVIFSYKNLILQRSHLFWLCYHNSLRTSPFSRVCCVFPFPYSHYKLIQPRVKLRFRLDFKHGYQIRSLYKISRTESLLFHLLSVSSWLSF